MFIFELQIYFLIQVLHTSRMSLNEKTVYWLQAWVWKSTNW